MSGCLLLNMLNNQKQMKHRKTNATQKTNVTQKTNATQKINATQKTNATQKISANISIYDKISIKSTYKPNFQIGIFSTGSSYIPSTNKIQSIGINENYSGNHKHFHVMQING